MRLYQFKTFMYTVEIVHHGMDTDIMGWIPTTDNLRRFRSLMTMPFPPRLPVTVYEILFIVSLLTTVPLALNGSVFRLFGALLLLYVCLRGVRMYQKKTISAVGKSVFISGCDTGFGHGTAQRLYQEGFRVFAGCLFPDGEGAKTLLEKCPDNLFIVPLDVTEEDSVRQAEIFVRDHLDDTCMWGVVNNAGILTFGDIELVSTETVKYIYDVNAFGMVRVTKAFLPLIRKSKGRITNVSSVTTRHVSPVLSTYVSSKVAVESVTDCLRMEMKKFGVGVSLIQPGSFGWNTEVFGIDNLRRITQTAERDWENLPEEVKRVYPMDYVQSMYKRDETHKRMGTSNNIGCVYEAVLETLVSSNPKPRTKVHGGPFYIDLLIVMVLLMEYLPTSISDWLACKLMFTPKLKVD